MVFRVEKIKRSIDSIGPINWAVKDEHEEKTNYVDGNNIKDFIFVGSE